MANDGSIKSENLILWLTWSEWLEQRRLGGGLTDGLRKVRIGGPGRQ
jgi:hypothetical protein